MTRNDAGNRLAVVGKNAIPELIASFADQALDTPSQLNDYDSPANWVIKTLSEIGPPARPHLMTALKHRSERVRARAATVLGQSGDEVAARALGELLEDPIPIVRASAALAIGRIGGPRAPTTLLRPMNDPSPLVQFNALIGIRLAVAKNPDPRVLQPLLSLLTDPECMLKEYVLMALAALQDTRAVDPIMSFHKESPSAYPQTVAYALGQLGDPRALPLLVDMLDHHHFWGPGSAVQALLNFRSDSRVPAAIERLLLTVEPELEATRMAAIPLLAKEGEWAGPLRAVALTRAKPSVQEAAEASLQRIFGEEFAHGGREWLLWLREVHQDACRRQEKDVASEREPVAPARKSLQREAAFALPHQSQVINFLVTGDKVIASVRCHELPAGPAEVRNGQRFTIPAITTHCAAWDLTGKLLWRIEAPLAYHMVVAGGHLVIAHHDGSPWSNGELVWIDFATRRETLRVAFRGRPDSLAFNPHSRTLVMVAHPLRPLEARDGAWMADAQIGRARTLIHDKRAPEKLIKALPHLEAAVRIAPDYELAALTYGLHLHDACHSAISREPRRRPDTKMLHRLASVSSHYLLRFDGDASKRQSASERLAFAAGSMPGIGTKLRPKPKGFERPLHMTPGFMLTAEECEVLEGCRRVVESSFRWRVDEAFSINRLATWAYRGMWAKEIPIERRRAWIDRILVAADRQLAQVYREKPLPGKIWDLLALRGAAAMLAVEEGDPARAEEILRGTWLRVPYDSDFKRMLDSPLPAEQDAWLSSRAFAMPIFLPQLPDSVQALVPDRKIPFPPRPVLRHKSADARSASTVAAVAVAKERLYVSVDGWPGVVPLDRNGRPEGKEAPLSDRDPTPIWDTLRILPRPPQKIARNVPIAVLDERLCFATPNRTGVVTLDAAEKTWGRIDLTDHRLSMIMSLHAIGAKRLFGTARTTTGLKDREPGGAHFVIDVETGKAEVLRRFTWRDPAALEPSYAAVWEHEGQWIGLGGAPFESIPARRLPDGLLSPPEWAIACRIDLLGRDPRRETIPLAGIHGGVLPHPGGGGTNAARLGDRWYANVRETVVECDPSGKHLRSWPGSASVIPPLSLLGRLGGGLRMPGDLPRNQFIGTVGPLLAVIELATSLTVFDPRTETMYGPFDIGAIEILPTTEGAWISTKDGPILVSADELIAAARAADAVETVAERARRVEESIARLDPMRRATVYFTLRRFEEARRLVEAELARPPDDPQALRRGRAADDVENDGRFHESEALLLLACLCGPDALDDARTLRECASRLAATFDGDLASLTAHQRRIAFTGMYLEYRRHRYHEDWPQTRIAAERILACFPYISDIFRREVTAGYEESIQRLHRTEGNHASPPTTRPESRP